MSLHFFNEFSLNVQLYLFLSKADICILIIELNCKYLWFTVDANKAYRLISITQTLLNFVTTHCNNKKQLLDLRTKPAFNFFGQKEI